MPYCALLAVFSFEWQLHCWFHCLYIHFHRDGFYESPCLCVHILFLKLDIFRCYPFADVTGILLLFWLNVLQLGCIIKMLHPVVFPLS